MASYLPIRALNRSQNVRIGGQRITSTTTAYVDISDAATRKELSYHSTLGAIFAVGPISGSNASQVVAGASVDEGSNATDLVVQVNPGFIRNRDTGAVVVQVKSTALTVGAANGTNPRIDIVQVHTGTGVATLKAGTAAASPVAPAPDASNVKIAEVLVPANDTAITTDQITDTAPRA